MKALAILVMLTSLAFSATRYVTPPLIVSGSILYCTDYYGDTIREHKLGDIIDGDIAIERCAYNKESVQEKQTIMKSMHNEEQDNIKQTVMEYLIGFIILCLLIIFSIGIYEIGKKD